MTLKSTTRRAKAVLRGLVNRRRNPLPVLAWSDTPRCFGRYLFICGAHRSGTTLLESALRVRCSFVGLEGPVPENEGIHLQDVYTGGGVGQFGLEWPLEPPPPDTAPELRRRLLSRWTPWMTGEGEALLEKSPPNLTKIAWLRAVFPGARFLVLARDPRVVSASTSKWVHYEIPMLMQNWDRAYATAWADLDTDCAVLTYEAFCVDPEGEIDRVIEALDLPVRDRPLPMPDRYRVLRNSNASYLSKFEGMTFGPGSWRNYGYDFD